MMRIGIAAALATLLVGGTAAGAGRSEGRAAPATLPAPPEGLGQLLFWRSGSVVGVTLGCGINLGSERISALGAGHYFILPLQPGAYQFNTRSEATDVLNVEVRKGETTFVKCAMRMGILVFRPDLSTSTAQDYERRRGDLTYVDSDDIGPKVLPDPAPAVAPTN